MRTPLTCCECAPLQALNPQTRAYLDQPDFQQMMRDMGGNPGNMNKYLADERFQNALQVCHPVVSQDSAWIYLQSTFSCLSALIVSAASASLSLCVSLLNTQVGLGLNIQTGDQFARGQQSDDAMPAGQRENGGASAPADRDEPQPSAAEPQSTPEPMDEQSEEEKVIGILWLLTILAPQALHGNVASDPLEFVEVQCRCLVSCARLQCCRPVPCFRQSCRPEAAVRRQYSLHHFMNTTSLVVSLAAIKHSSGGVVLYFCGSWASSCNTHVCRNLPSGRRTHWPRRSRAMQPTNGRTSKTQWSTTTRLWSSSMATYPS